MGEVAWRPRLVGRAEMLGDLRAELRRATGGTLRCALLVGDAGIGKTRLADELAARASRTGALALTSRAYALGGATAFGLWIEALERHLRELDADQIRALCGGFTADLAGVLRSVAALGGGAERQPPRLRLMEGLTVLVANLARSRPVVLILDDVHLADASSLQLLHYVASGLADARILIIATARGAELSAAPSAQELLWRLEQEGVLRRLELSPLPRADVAQLASAALSGTAVPGALADWLAERSVGNPLFVLGLLQALLDEGADLSAPVLSTIPLSLSGRIAGDLGSLDEPSLATLELLAVLARRVELRELELLAGRQPARLLEIVELLVRLRLVIEEERGRVVSYELAHPLVQEAICSRIGATRQRSLHRLLARGLAGSGRLGEAALHFSRSAEPGDDEAIAGLCRALHQADERESHAEAIAILDALLDLVPSGDQRWLTVLDAMSAHANWVVEHRADMGALTGIRAMREIERVLAHGGDVSRQATAQLRLASFLAWGAGEYGEAERSIHDALELFARVGDRSGALLSRNELAWITGLGGDLASQLAGAREVLAAAEATGDTLAALQAVGQIGSVEQAFGRFDDALGALRRSAELAELGGKSYRHTWSQSIVAETLALQGRSEEALALLDRTVQADPAYAETLLLECRTTVEWIAGRFASALSSARETLAWNASGLSRRRAWALGLAALSATELGDLAEARALVLRAEHAYGGRRCWYWHLYHPWAAAVIKWHEGDPHTALRDLRATAKELTALNALLLLPFVLADVAEIAAAANEPEAALSAATQLRSVAKELDNDAARGLASSSEAVALLTTADSAGAQVSAETALGLLSPGGFAAHRGRALAVLGIARARARSADAVTPLREAVAAFAEMGAVWRREEAVSALERLGPSGRRAAAATQGRAGLTRRELEIALLAVQGLTAREIGERLFIGTRTVETHLAHVYAKLGVASKVELIRRHHEFALNRASQAAPT
jgi:DNA-binding CsgD family transcriptional regulator